MSELDNDKTDKQFEEIVKSISNGNFTQAAQEYLDFDFYASTIDAALREYLAAYEYTNTRGLELAIDLFYVIQQASIMSKS